MGPKSENNRNEERSEESAGTRKERKERGEKLPAPSQNAGDPERSTVSGEVIRRQVGDK